MLGHLRIICSKEKTDAVLEKIEVFLSSVSSVEQSKTSVDTYWKEKDCSLVQAEFPLMQSDKDDLISKVLQLTGRSALDDVIESDTDLELGAYASYYEMTSNPDRFFCTVYISKAL